MRMCILLTGSVNSSLKWHESCCTVVRILVRCSTQSSVYCLCIYFKKN